VFDKQNGNNQQKWLQATRKQQARVIYRERIALMKDYHTFHVVLLVLKDWKIQDMVETALHMVKNCICENFNRTNEWNSLEYITTCGNTYQ
jgi:hypothetical protein